jgi:glycerol transport system permease protein
MGILHAYRAALITQGEGGGTMTPRFSFAPSIFVALLMVPIYWLITISVKSIGEISGSITLYPHAPTAENFLFILSDASWYYGYVNATIYVLMNVVISLAVAVPAAYGFSRYRFFGGRVLFFGFLAFRMLAPAVLLLPFVQIFSELNLIDTYVAVAIAHCFFNVPLAIWILEGFISSIPREMDDIAKLDGYGFPRFFFRILLPQIAPGISVTAFFCFMFSWIESLLSNALTVVHAKPINGIMTRVGSVLAADVPLLAAASVLGLIPGVILIVFMKKHLARGFSMGRVV